MENKETNKKISAFWKIYIGYILALVALISGGLILLWNFLAVYEETRPVHFMEKTLTVFQESETEQLKTYLTNTVENPYEDTAALLSVFYDSIENKELSYGKLSGKYTEQHPVYAVLADEEHVATVSFVSDEMERNYGFCGWKLEEISLQAQPAKSFAVTVPSSMSVTVNGVPVAEQHTECTAETEAPVNYVNYMCNGELYLEPEIQVIDCNGAVVDLQEDAATGGLFYPLYYVTAPTTMKVFVGEKLLGEENTLDTEIAAESLNDILEMASDFPEYQAFLEKTTLPAFRKYYIDFVHDKEAVTAVDRFGTARTLEYNVDTRTYFHDLVSEDSLLEECKERAIDFLEKYALFCAGADSKEAELREFFPKNSAYGTKILSVNNNWYTGRIKNFSNHQLKEFFAYTENLAYIYVTIDQETIISGTNEQRAITITIPLWMVKEDGEWYIARLEFDASSED